jgi:EmrB/QacA subfamily drug resistance transporter
MTNALTKQAAPAGSDLSSRRWWMLATVVLAQLMVVLDATVVNIALPAAQADLGFSNADRQWVITAYTLAAGSLLLLGGKVSDLIGRRRAFLIGVSGFAVASAVGGAAPGFGVLLAARAVQGVSGALLAPTALAILATTFTDPRERARAFGVSSAAIGAGSAIGLLLGGVLTQDLNWRWTLYINVAIALVAGVGGAVLIRRTERVGPRPVLDVPGAALVSGALFTLVFGLSRAEVEGWGSAWCWGMLAAAGVLLTGFVVRQRRAAHPLLPLSVVLDRNRGAAYGAVLLATVGMFGALLFVTYYLQGSLGYSPIQTGLAFLPMTAAMVCASQLASNILLPRFGPKVLVPCGMMLAAAGMVVLTRLHLHSSYPSGILPALLATGFGIGTILTSSVQTATLDIDPKFTGVGSAMVNTSQQIGGSIGTALLNTLVATATAGYLDAHRPASAATTALATLHGYTTAFWWGAGIYTSGALLTALLFRRRQQHTQ